MMPKLKLKIILIIVFGLLLPFGIDQMMILIPIMMFLFFTSKRVIIKSQIYFLMTLMLIPLLIGLITFPLYDVMKDVIYFFVPICGLLIGWYLYRHYTIKVVLRGILYVGCLLAIVSLFCSIYTYGIRDAIFNARDIKDNKEFSSLFVPTSLMVTLSLCIAMYNIIRYRKRYKTIAVICLLAIIGSGLRSVIIASVICVMSVVIPLYKRKKLKFALIMAALITLSYLYYSQSSQHTKDLILNTFEEISISNDEVQNRNLNYRGFEAKFTLDVVDRLPLFKQCFGAGFGAKVYMGVHALVREYVPIMHNGYVYIILKSGYFGLFMYLAWGVSLLVYFMRWKTCDVTERLVKYIAIGSVLSVFATNLVITGLFNVVTLPLSMMIGFGYCIKRKTMKYGCVNCDSKL